MNQGGMDCTSHYGGYHMSGRGMRRLTVFVGEQSPREVDLGQFHKEYISFGRSPDNDLVLPSPNVSKHHGLADGQWSVCGRLEQHQWAFIQWDKSSQWSFERGRYPEN